MNRRFSRKRLLARVGARLWLWLLLWPFFAPGQTNSSAPAYAPNRFLLVVETSRTMQHRLQPLLQATRDIIGSNLSGQGRRGDTLGIWTFNEELSTGLIPLQQWMPDDQKKIADRLAGFLSAQKFEKRGRFEKVIPALDRVVRSSPYLTVILICMGDEELRGTPYDQRINAFFRTWQLQQQDAGTPFVIALRSQGGRYVDCTMNPSPWAAELPALPRELLAPLPPPRPMAKETPKPATSSVPPLIISGKKREAPALAKAADVGATNLPATTPTPAPLTTVEQSNTITSTSLVATKTDQPAGPPGAQPGTTPEPKPPIPAPDQTSPGAPVPPLTANTSSERTKSQPSSAVETLVPTTSQPLPNQTNQIAALSKPQGVLSAPATTNPSPTVRAAPESGLPAQALTNSPVSNRVHPLVLAALGGVALVAAAGAFWVSRRRKGTGPETSIITESLDRHKR